MNRKKVLKSALKWSLAKIAVAIQTSCRDIVSMIAWRTQQIRFDNLNDCQPINRAGEISMIERRRLDALSQERLRALLGR